jgi:cardiolipin synthase
MTPEPAPSSAVGTDAGPGDELDRILTVPNVITVARLAFLPVYLWLLLERDDRVTAAVLLAVLGATDFVDGYIARHFHQASRIGRILDPTVDRLLFFVGIGGIIAVGGAPLWFCVVVLVREVLVASVTVVLTLRGIPPVHVTWVGKAGTFGLMFAFPLFLGGSADIEHADLVTAAAWIAAVPGLALSLYSAVAYVPEWRTAVARHHALEANAGSRTGADG